jgi:hypothetical protein
MDDATLTQAAKKALEALMEARTTGYNLPGRIMDEAIIELREALDGGVYRCHADVFDDEVPDACVLDTGDHNDCMYARKHGMEARKFCGSWKPLKRVDVWTR